MIAVRRDDPDDTGIGPELTRGTIPRRELVTLRAYLETGSHKAAAHRLGISESTSRQRVSQLLGRVGACNVTQAVWMLREVLEAGGCEHAVCILTRPHVSARDPTARHLIRGYQPGCDARCPCPITAWTAPNPDSART